MSHRTPAGTFGSESTINQDCEYSALKSTTALRIKAVGSMLQSKPRPASTDNSFMFDLAFPGVPPPGDSSLISFHPDHVSCLTKHHLSVDALWRAAQVALRRVLVEVYRCGCFLPSSCQRTACLKACRKHLTTCESGRKSAHLYVHARLPVM